MTPFEIKQILLWSTCINYAILFTWFFVFMVARNTLYFFHARFFRLTVDTFDAIHYAGMGIYKLSILMFNLVPWLAITIIGN